MGLPSLAGTLVISAPVATLLDKARSIPEPHSHLLLNDARLADYPYNGGYRIARAQPCSTSNPKPPMCF